MTRSPVTAWWILGLVGSAATIAAAESPVRFQPVAPAPAASPAQPVAQAAPPALDIGGRAPALSIKQWVRGEPIAAFEPGKVYVVEFWATWCQPCRRAVPLLSELQRRHTDKGLRIVGVASQETGGVEDIERYVTQQGDRIAYSLAWDDQSRTDRAWMGASQSRGIPTAFIVDQQGRIAWIGHPLKGLEQALDQVLAGTFDMKAEAEAARLRRDVQARTAPLARAYADAVRSGDHAAALRAIEQILAIDPRINGEWALGKFQLLAVQMKDYDKAYAFARACVDDTLRSNAEALVNLAWIILEEPGLETRDTTLALRAAQRANDITGDKEPVVLMALGRAQLAAGQGAGAIKTQERAVELSPPGAERDEQRRRLDEYKKKVGG